MTSKEDDGLDKILDKMLDDFVATDYAVGLPSRVPKSEWQTVKQTAHQAILNLVERVIGEDYIFERPKGDYLPNVYRRLSAKNELRAEQRQRLKELNG